MKIVAAMDKKSYSAGIVNDLAKLAVNTWADVTMLGIQTGNSGGADGSLAKVLLQYKTGFLKVFPDEDLPYPTHKEGEIVETQKERWEVTGEAKNGRKIFSLIIRNGDPVKEILAEAREQQNDLLVLGCTSGRECQWDGEPYLPQKIAKDAPCSVMVVKKEKHPKKIVCCMDQASISQESLEIINQVVTLHGAELKIIGLTGPKGDLRGKDEAETKINDVVKYYTDRGIHARVKLVNTEDLEEYVTHISQQALIALWLGKRSLLKKIFFKDYVDELITRSQSSVLILK